MRVRKTRSQLHARGVELVVERLDAAEPFKNMPPDHIEMLFRETSLVLGDLLARDIPRQHHAAAPDSQHQLKLFSGDLACCQAGEVRALPRPRQSQPAFQCRLEFRDTPPAPDNS